MNGLGGSVPCPVARRLVAKRFTWGSLMDLQKLPQGVSRVVES